MTDGKMFRWYTDADIESIRKAAFDKAVEIAVRAVLAMDPYIYDEDTVRAAADVVRDVLKEKP